MQDLVAELARAPLYAQVMIALFATAAVASLLGPTLRDRGCRGRFAALADSFGQRIATSKDGPPRRGS